MQSAYLELCYRRREDQRRVTLLAPLPTIRALTIGGSPSDLRLPGIDPADSFAIISFTYDRFRLDPIEIERPAAAPPVTLNGQPLPHDGLELNEGDVLRIGDFEITFHDGELPSEPPTIDTPLRWKMPRTLVDDSALYESSDETSRAYIEEFQVSARPLMQAQRHADVQKLAEAEIKRIVRSEEVESLETYASFLWWTRARSAREAHDPQALDIAVEAIDLHPDCMPLLVVCGTSFLRGGVWEKASDAFLRAQSGRKLPFLASVHDSRVGLILAEHLRGIELGGKPDARPFDKWKTNEWEAPTIGLHAPGDESLLWRLAHYAEIFGDDPKKLRFVFRGSDEERSDETYDVQRWEIANLKTGQLRRRLLKMPTLPYADASLVVESGLLRQAYSSEEKDWTQCIVDLSNSSDSDADTATADAANAAPLIFEPAALQVLPSRIGGQPACVRIECDWNRRDQRFVEISIVPRPSKGDVVYQQGAIRVAIARKDVVKLAGASLSVESGRKRAFVVTLADGQRVGARVSLLRGLRFNAAAIRAITRRLLESVGLMTLVMVAGYGFFVKDNFVGTPRGVVGSVTSTGAR